MTVVSMPKESEYDWPTLVVLRRAGSMTIEEMDKAVFEVMGLSAEQLAVPHSTAHKTKAKYRVAWSRTKLKEMKLADNATRGVWTVTERGRTVRKEEIPDLIRDVNSRRYPKSVVTDEPEQVTDVASCVLESEDVAEQQRKRLGILSRLTGMSETEIIKALLDAFEISNALQLAPAVSVTEVVEYKEEVDEIVPVHLTYKTFRTEGEFYPRTSQLQIVSGKLQGKMYKSPSGAGSALYRFITGNPKMTCNGWITWYVTETQSPLQSIRNNSVTPIQ